MTMAVVVALLVASVTAPPGPPASAATANQIVTAAYQGLLGRTPDSSGRTYWAGLINSGVRAGDVVGQIGDSDEQREHVVTEAYDEILDRGPDSGGLAFWSDGLIDLRTARGLHAQLFGSAEYYERAGGTDPLFVDSLYTRILDRSPEPGGRSYWTARLVAGLSRTDVAAFFLGSPEAILQPTLTIASSTPATGAISTDVSVIDIELNRTIEAEASTMLVSVAGQRLTGTVTAGPDNRSLRFIAADRPIELTPGSLHPGVVTVFAFDGTTVDRTDFGFTYRAGEQPTLDELIVALYGHAEAPVLGILGEGSPAQAMAHLTNQMAPYENQPRPVTPAFELIATLVTASPGADGLYRRRTDHALIQPYLDTIRANDGYLILDLQAGRADLEDEARSYEPLLLEPEVGLAIDPEWKLDPGETPVGHIGNVRASEINRVSAYLSELVIANGLPSKLLIVHRFRPDMVTNPEQVVARPGVIMLWQADGEGGPAAKIGDYDGLLPDRFARGFKVFYDEDSPTMTPAQVLARLTPDPDYVSYQ